MARPLKQSDPWFEAPHTASPGGNFAGLERIGDARIPRRALLPRAHPTPTDVPARRLPPPIIDRRFQETTVKLAVSTLLIAGTVLLVSLAGADEPRPSSGALACPPGLTEEAKGCELESQNQAPGTWDLAADESPQALFSRATRHDLWMRQRLIPAGGVMPGILYRCQLHPGARLRLPPRSRHLDRRLSGGPGHAVNSNGRGGCQDSGPSNGAGSRSLVAHLG